MSNEVARLPRNVLYVPHSINLTPGGNRPTNPVPSSQTPRLPQIGEDRVQSLPPDVVEAGNDLARFRQAAQLQSRRNGDNVNLTQEATTSHHPTVQGRLAVTHERNVATGQAGSGVALSGRAQTPGHTSTPGQNHQPPSVAANLTVGAQTRVDNRGQSQQEVYAEAGVERRAGNLRVAGQARVSQTTGSGHPATTTVRGQIQVASDTTELTGVVERRTGQGQPQLTLQARLQQQLDGGLRAEGYYQYQQQGGDRSHTVGAALSGPFTDQTNFRASVEHTLHQGHRHQHETAMRVGLTREFSS